KVALSEIIAFFFFQGDDGIRDRNVTGVQTCALPISSPSAARLKADDDPSESRGRATGQTHGNVAQQPKEPQCPPQLPARPHRTRSEERRVGKECRCRWWLSGSESRTVDYRVAKSGAA